MEEKEAVTEAAKKEEEEEEQVWSWGAGTDGQLGTGKLQDEHLPQPLSSFGPPISVLSCGGAHVIALTSGGRAVTWGRGTSGQLGHGYMVNSLLPKTVYSLKDFVITHVSAGWNHSGFVSDTGFLFTCGDGSFGQLGHGDYDSRCSPTIVSYFTSEPVKQIACGMRHSIVLLAGHSNDQVFGFGSGKRGQLGVSKDKIKSMNLPQAALGLEDVEVANISANGDHSAALSADGHLYTWGRGFGGNPDIYCPFCVTASLVFTQAALGWNHALALTGDGEVFMLGGNSHGALSNLQKSNLEHLSDDPKDIVTEKICNLNDLKVVQIAAGAEHSALVIENGLIMTWGWGEHGQLGLGNTNDQTGPQILNLCHGDSRKYKSKVYCGSGFTFAVRSHILPPDC